MALFGGMEWLVSGLGAYSTASRMRKLTSETDVQHHFEPEYSHGLTEQLSAYFSK